MADLTKFESNGEPLPAAVAPEAENKLSRLRSGRRPANVGTQIGSALPISREAKALEVRIANGHAAYLQLASNYLQRALPRAKATGELLSAWKKVIGHGQLTSQLEALEERIGLSPRSARAYMRVAKHWKRLETIAGDTLSEMSVRAALTLLSGAKAGTRISSKADGDVIDGEFTVVGASESTNTEPPSLETLGKSQAFCEFFGAALLDPWELTLCENVCPEWSKSELRNLPIRSLLRPSSHVYLLACDRHLTDALRTMKAWGYAFSHSLVISRNNWLDQAGRLASGHYFVLCGGRSDTSFRETGLSSWIDAAGDSAEEIRQRVELASEGPYLQVLGDMSTSGPNWTGVSVSSNEEHEP